MNDVGEPTTPAVEYALSPTRRGVTNAAAVVMVSSIAYALFAFGLGYPGVAALAAMVGLLGPSLHPVRRSVAVAPGHIDGHALVPEEQVILFCGGEVCVVKTYASEAEFLLCTPDELPKARRLANELAARLETSVVECVAETYAEACRLEIAYRVHHDRRMCADNWPDREQTVPSPPELLQADLDAFTFPLDHDVVALDRQAVRTHRHRHPLVDLLDVQMVVCSAPPGEREQCVAVVLYTEAGTQLLFWEPVSSSLRSPERRRRLGELLWLTRQIRDAAKAAQPSDASDIPHTLTRLSDASG